jgi:hypothetical protein
VKGCPRFGADEFSRRHSAAPRRGLRFLKTRKADKARLFAPSSAISVLPNVAWRYRLCDLRPAASVMCLLGVTWNRSSAKDAPVEIRPHWQRGGGVNGYIPLVPFVLSFIPQAPLRKTARRV